MAKMILVGDVNLMGVDDAGAPFAMLGAEMRAADLVFANLECLLYEPPEGHAVEHEGFLPIPQLAARPCRRPGSARSGWRTPSTTARRRSSARSPGSTRSASPLPQAGA